MKNNISTFCLPGLSGDNFLFDGNGDGPARYNIIHFKQVEYGKFQWVKVGEYYQGALNLNMKGNVLLNISILFLAFENPHIFD